jgi:hypothetical protein
MGENTGHKKHKKERGEFFTILVCDSLLLLFCLKQRSDFRSYKKNLTLFVSKHFNSIETESSTMQIGWLRSRVWRLSRGFVGRSVISRGSSKEQGTPICPSLPFPSIPSMKVLFWIWRETLQRDFQDAQKGHGTALFGLCLKCEPSLFDGFLLFS